MTEFLKENIIYTIKDLKDFLNQFDEDREVVIQMVDGEYNRVGYIDSYSDNHNEFTKKYYLPKEHHDALMLICYSESISSQY